jgi:excisionase family DNA binding protein
MEPQGSHVAVPEAVGHTELSTHRARAVARQWHTRRTARHHARDVERNTLAERLAYSPDEAAELLGISTELIHDLLRTGQLGWAKAGRRRLIGKHHLEAFLSSGQ